MIGMLVTSAISRSGTHAEAAPKPPHATAIRQHEHARLGRGVSKFLRRRVQRGGSGHVGSVLSVSSYTSRYDIKTRGTPVARTPRTQSLTKAEYEALAASPSAATVHGVQRGRGTQGSLTPQQHQALLAIKGAPGREMLAVGEIAEALCLRPHSAVELVDRMAELGLVERHADADDHRRVWVRLTTIGEDVLARLSAEHLRELQAIGPGLARMLERFRGGQ